MIILAVLLGGFTGGMLRYALSLIMRSPAGTFSANIIGAALIGMAAGYFRAADVSEVYAVLIVTGLAGGLSTWSTLAKELGQMIKRRQYLTAAGYAFFTVSIGLIMAWRGLTWVTRAYYGW